MPSVRTAHGTRVARAITCVACGARDTVKFAPRDASKAYCRRCAADLLGVADPEAGIHVERPRECVECGRIEVTQRHGEEDFVCRDCRAGISSQQQNRRQGAERLGEGKVLRVRREGRSRTKR